MNTLLALIGDTQKMKVHLIIWNGIEPSIPRFYCVLGIPTNLYDAHCGSEETFPNLCKVYYVKVDA